jgi:hypothetical protein
MGRRFMEKMEILDGDQVDHFLEKGYVQIPDCFDKSVADEWRALAFERLGYDPSDPKTWEEPRIHLPRMNTIEVPEFAPKAWLGMCDLMGGAERIKKPVVWADGFICNFGIRADEPWQPPSAEVPGWHKDGDWFKHFLDSPEQGLLTIVIWSDILPQSGGTFVAPDSVGHIARYLAQYPDGLLNREAQFGQQIEKCQVFEEVTGQVGDVILIHPYMLHASSGNPSGRARFITNPAISLNEPMCFNRPDGDYSLVEQVVLNALDTPALDWEITSERERVVPERVARQQKMLEEQKARLGAA